MRRRVLIPLLVLAKDQEQLPITLLHFGIVRWGPTRMDRRRLLTFLSREMTTWICSVRTCECNGRRAVDSHCLKAPVCVLYVQIENDKTVPALSYNFEDDDSSDDESTAPPIRVAARRRSKKESAATQRARKHYVSPLFDDRGFPHPQD